MVTRRVPLPPVSLVMTLPVALTVWVGTGVVAPVLVLEPLSRAGRPATAASGAPVVVSLLATGGTWVGNSEFSAVSTRSEDEPTLA